MGLALRRTRECRMKEGKNRRMIDAKVPIPAMVKVGTDLNLSYAHVCAAKCAESEWACSSVFVCFFLWSYNSKESIHTVRLLHDTVDTKYEVCRLGFAAPHRPRWFTLTFPPDVLHNAAARSRTNWSLLLQQHRRRKKSCVRVQRRKTEKKGEIEKKTNFEWTDLEESEPFVLPQTLQLQLLLLLQ